MEWRLINEHQPAPYVWDGAMYDDIDEMLTKQKHTVKGNEKPNLFITFFEDLSNDSTNNDEHDETPFFNRRKWKI